MQRIKWLAQWLLRIAIVTVLVGAVAPKPMIAIIMWAHEQLNWLLSLLR